MKLLLIVSGSFPPWNMIGALRWGKLCKYLAEGENELFVVARSCHMNIKNDQLLEDVKKCKDITYLEAGIIGKLGKIIVRIVCKLNRDEKELINEKYDEYIMTHKAIKFLANLDFGNSAYQFIKKDMDKYDIIISTNPIGAHWGAMYAAKKLGVPWIADFRDPLYTPGVKRTFFNRFMAYWQDQILRRANAVIVVSKGVKTTLCCGREAYLQKTRVIYNGYDAEDRPMESARVGKAIRFAYTGILYSGKRDLTPFFTALGVLCSEGLVRKEDLVFDYAGKDIEVLRAQAEHGGMEGILRDHGFVSRSESLALQNDADVLVMATYNDEGNPGVMTGKLYEYMMFKKPILALVGGNVRGSELKEVIESCDVGYCHEENFDDPEALKDFLRSVISSHGQEKQPCFAYKTQRFAYEGLAGEVETLIEELLKR